MSLKARTIKASVVMLLGHTGSQLVRFVGSLVTTRLLAPELFGVMAIANSIAIMATLFSDMGFRLNVVRSERGDDPAFLKTIFTFKVLQGLLLFAVICALALGFYLAGQSSLLPEASTYASSDLPVALLIIAFSPLVTGFTSIQVDVHIRKQEIVWQTVLQLLAQCSALSFIILTAIENPTIYSLAFSNVIASAVAVLGSYVIYDRKLFGFAWDAPSISEIIKFGKWIFASTAVTAVSNNIDKLMLGYFLTSKQMGVYSIAWLIFVALGAIFNKLTTPLFSAVSDVIRNRPAELGRIYYKVRFYRDLLTCIPVCIVIANGDYLVSLLYDHRFEEAGLFLQVMSISYLIECFLLKNHVITAMGNSKIQFQLSLWRLVGLCLLIPLGNYYLGTVGVILAVALRPLFGSWILFQIFRDKNLLQWRFEMRTVLIILGSFAIGLVVRYLFGLAFPVLESWKEAVL